ncbi:signal recognition particle-docking protein FtsY [Pectobacterium brasiliense]|uniref:signal recognition particle-docking protein FtsY n=1 Tax=Pectobacterium brasiliense TaxID=180957 RepID=UPI001CE145EC|nr:signal recognition particle-docking protein FtsY [Pectobacterium brasiliense]MCA5920760.1 signal recognition particle-docking protein FtsY [Pectobacterium brasiliense]MCA5928120.1 signal recognition particle-docking protein FtsY [Pectobacterium brasiliense]MCA5936861.1 signal recognition particle-docking protein FtsY [Pectobacterium brasiliense]MCA5940690.1 signal recognition particle-docking protein FtsY [Pectobacterium brasiliense]MCA5944342.1 signal recognition particle-docking protein F
MSKEKKRGFFSWLGLGKQEEKQQEQPQEQPVFQEKPTVQEKIVVDEQPSAAEPDAAASAHQTVEHAPEQVEKPLPEVPVVEEKIKVEAEQLIQPAAERDVTATADEPTVATPEPAVSAPIISETDDRDVIEHDVLDRDVVDPIIQTEIADSATVANAEPDVAQQEYEEQESVQPDDVPVVAQEQERPTKEGFFARLKRSLVKTRQNLGSGFIGLFRGKKIDDDLFDELEEQLLIADVGVETTRKIITSLTEHASRRQLKDADTLFVKLKEEMAEILAKVDAPLNIEGKTPYVILMVGVNGVGKTTTIGKMARQFQAQGKSVMLAAGDTFRAAAVEQLQVWGQRNNVAVVAQHTGADSASVIFDAIQAAKARGVDVLIADTAGRLQNKAHLMEELKKIVRVMKKLDEDAPHEVMLTLDASTGQNAVSQAKLFNEAVGLTGITLTKLDGTAKGGVIFAIADQFAIPIRYIGVGEGIEDLRPFKADDFIEALFARED